MAGKKPRLTPLAARKQLLIAESELNRTILAGDCEKLVAGVRIYVSHARSLGSIFNVAKFLSGAFLTFQASRPAPQRKKQSWLSTIINGAARATNLWNSFRSRNEKQHE